MPKDLRVSMVMTVIWHIILIGASLLNNLIPRINLVMYKRVAIMPILSLLALFQMNQATTCPKWIGTLLCYRCKRGLWLRPPRCYPLYH